MKSLAARGRPRCPTAVAAVAIALIAMALVGPSASFLSSPASRRTATTPTTPSPPPRPSPSTASPLSMISGFDWDDADDDALRTLKFSTLRSLCVDYGLVRTGLAVTTGGYRPRPLAILSNLDALQLSRTIVDNVKSEGASNVVLGLPLHKNGTDSEQSGVTRDFAQILLWELRRRCGTNVELCLWDERYSSKEAASRIRMESISRGERIPSASELSGDLDADAACIILEDYYAELGEGAEIVTMANETLAAECARVYRENLANEERRRQEMVEEREQGRNARREMIKRVKAEEAAAAAAAGGGDAGSSGKKKKKKKKKKK